MLTKTILSLFTIILSFSFGAQAQDLPAGQIYAKGVQSSSLAEALAQVQPGGIVILGEQHGTAVISAQEIQVLGKIRENGLKVSVGMEFFNYTQQADVDAWRSGVLSEADFLKKIAWTGFPFQYYGEQASFPVWGESYTIGLNIPMAVTDQIAINGLDSLTPDQKALMPPNFTLGNAGYLQRFTTVMNDSGHLPSPDDLNKYFTAQSAWDDTMAWQATNFIATHPDQVLVIVVGEFHVQYGGGLPDRIKARSASPNQQITTFSLVNLEGMTADEQEQAVRPDAVYGERADFVWTSRF